jgi:proteasome lid subunit RPN8/RPN11
MFRKKKDQPAPPEEPKRDTPPTPIEALKPVEQQKAPEAPKSMESPKNPIQIKISNPTKIGEAPKTIEKKEPEMVKKVGSGKKDNTMVIIKPKAYITMLRHVLRFGSNVKSKDEYREVMGMLMGKLQDGKNPNIKDVVIEDAVPVSHGGKVEVAFAPEDYINFSILDSQFAEKGIFNIGWYHSHPGLTCFFSAVDIRNQLGFQSANPAAIGLVFDHERLKNPDDMGFDSYRLDDPSQGQMSDYHEVNWMLEAPESPEFYTDMIKGLFDAYHKGEPPILELSEVPDVFGDLSMPGRNAMMAKEPELNFINFAEKFTKGINDFTHAFFQPFFLYLNEWASAMSKGLIDKNIEILEILTDLKKNISESIGGLQSWFKFQINDQLRNVDILIDDHLEQLTNQQKEIIGKIEGIDNIIKNKIGDAFTKAMAATLTKLTDDMQGTLGRFKTAMDAGEALLTKVNAQQGMVTQSIDEYSKQTASLKKTVDNLMNSIEMTLNTSLGVMGKEMDDLAPIQKDLLDSVKALKNIADTI